MTICTASQFLWHYPDGTVGAAIVAASDRMMSDLGLGIEYEASRWKGLILDKHHVVLVAGELAFHSMAIAELNSWSHEQQAPITSAAIAYAYGEIVRRLTFERAAKEVLGPLGVPKPGATGLAGLKNFQLPGTLHAQICDQLQSITVDCEAIVAGCDDRISHLFRIDNRGLVTQHADIGFVSIGNGGIHASGYYMQSGYYHLQSYNRALLSTFFAKKRAEVAPGVGPHTDMFLITGDGADYISADTMNALEESYAKTQRAASDLLAELERDLAASGAFASKAFKLDLSVPGGTG